MFRYWTDVLSDDQAANLARNFAQVLTDIITQPRRTIAEMNGPQNNQVLPESGNIMVQQIVKECVHQIIDQMFKTGELVRYRPESDSSVEREHTQANVQLTNGHSQLEDSLIQRALAAQSNPTAPLDYVEKKLRSLWSVFLDVTEDSIGSNDSFFQLGGDSIAAMSLVGAARDENLSITVADVFRHPTLSEMVDVVRSAEETSGQQISSPQISSPQASSPQASSPRASNLQNTGLQTTKPHTTKPQTSNAIIEYKETLEAKTDTPTHSLYQRFSLLNTTNVDIFLQNTICPKVHTFRGGIVDVFPVTDFQALAVTGALLKSKWMLNYFYLDGRGALDLRRLKKSAFRLVQAFDILRTVFVHYGDRFLQVVLRQLQPEFTVCETDMDLDDFTTALQRRDREDGPVLGEAYVQFKVVRQKDSDRHRIIMRLSHAQYDGVCMPKILESLQAGYQDQPIPATPAFSNYVRFSAGAIVSDHYDHWNHLLKGATMTDIVHREGPKYNKAAGTVTTLKRVVRLSSLASHNITPATVIKAAWSFVLAELSARSDVVFGHVISGRNAGIPGVENIIGPCLNIVPVRTRFQSGWTVLDLIRSIQEQQVANMPYEALGFREIIQKCTDWPKWTNFSTVVQHQNMGRKTQLSLGGNQYDIGAVGSQDDFADFALVSTPQEDGTVELSLTFTLDSTITMPFAEMVFSKFCATAVDFSAKSHMVLSSPADLSGTKRQTLDETTDTSDDTDSLSAKLQRVGKKELLAISETLTRAWRQVLRNKTSKFLHLDLASNFFDLGGDIIGLAQLTTLLKNEGFRLGVEDLFDHQTMGQQLALLAAEREEERLSASGSVETLAIVEEEPQPKKPGLWRKTMGRVLNKRGKRGDVGQDAA